MPLDNHKGDTKWEYIFDSHGSSWYWCNWYHSCGASGKFFQEILKLEHYQGCPCWQHECKHRLWRWTCYTFRKKKKKKNLHTTGCFLHQNELPFRVLFKHLDGTTKSPTTFNGPLGKLYANDCHNLPQKSFSAVENPLQFHFGMEDMDSLKSDQILLYEYTVGISRGKVDPRFALWKIGPLNQARWLTLAIRLMCLWTRGEYPQNLSTKLYSLINFIVS